MTYSIFDTGNLVVSFDEEHAAREALGQIAREDPDHGDTLLMLTFDDDGHIVDEVVPAELLAA